MNGQAWRHVQWDRQSAIRAEMKVLVTGSSGYLGQALMRCLPAAGHEAVGLDVVASPWTEVIGSVVDRELVQALVAGVDAVVHTATLQKPHAATRTRQEFVDINITGTLNLLEEAAAAGVGRFILASTTSVFGRALTPASAAPAAWITDAVVPVPKNIYGATKKAAEELAELVHRDHGLACVVLRISRFFPGPDDRAELAGTYEDVNIKLNELLYRRVDLEDAVSAHLAAIDRAPEIGFGRYIVSATSPFREADLDELRIDAASVVMRLFPDCPKLYADRGWRLFPSIDRVYVNDEARQALGWRPRYDFAYALERLKAGEDPRSELDRTPAV